jgi:hypothetical protein
MQPLLLRNEGEIDMKSKTPWLFIILCTVVGTASAQSDHVTTTTRSDGTQVTLTSGQPAAQSYGPRPAFEQLDSNHDGYITRTEAESYTPLYNDFDHLTHGDRISKAQYSAWDYR